MSQPTTNSSGLDDLLDEYAKGFWQNAPNTALLEEVRKSLPRTDNPEEFRRIAARLWEDYFCVDVDLMIEVLRRWVEVEPSSNAAKRELGTYLLAHGPDWDEEGNRLLQEADAS